MTPIETQILNDLHHLPGMDYQTLLARLPLSDRGGILDVKAGYNIIMSMVRRQLITLDLYSEKVSLTQSGVDIRMSD